MKREDAEVEQWKANSEQNETTAKNYRAEVERLRKHAAKFEGDLERALARVAELEGALKKITEQCNDGLAHVWIKTVARAALERKP